MSSFEVGESQGPKAEPGVELPFGGLEEPPLAALHHLHQVCLASAFPSSQALHSVRH